MNHPCEFMACPSRHSFKTMSWSGGRRSQDEEYLVLLKVAQIVLQGTHSRATAKRCGRAYPLEHSPKGTPFDLVWDKDHILQVTTNAFVGHTPYQFPQFQRLRISIGVTLLFSLVIKWFIFHFFKDIPFTSTIKRET